MKGRKPKPKNLHLLEGSYRQDRHNTGEPILAKSLPRCPRHLNKIAKKEFRRIVRLYKNVNVLHELDMVGLVAYCELWSTMVRCSETANGLESFYVKNSKGNLSLHPCIQEYRRCVTAIRPLLAAFGFTPLERPRIKTEEFQEAGRNKIEEMLFGG